eukprot:g5722.t1
METEAEDNDHHEEDTDNDDNKTDDGRSDDEFPCNGGHEDEEDDPKHSTKNQSQHVRIHIQKPQLLPPTPPSPIPIHLRQQQQPQPAKPTTTNVANTTVTRDILLQATPKPTELFIFPDVCAKFSDLPPTAVDFLCETRRQTNNRIVFNDLIPD